jgi:hypothetical protein
MSVLREALKRMEFNKSATIIEREVHHERTWFTTPLNLLGFKFGFTMLDIYWLGRGMIFAE